MTNEILKDREAIERGLVSAQLCADEGFIELSPCGQYQLEVECYATKDFPHDATIAVAVIRRISTGEVVATVKRNDTRCFYTWISRDDHDYLILPEDLEGHSVVDLTIGKVEGFSSPDDGFIWTEFHPSPDKTKLAIVGCYWACPYAITAYDFRQPMSLPLPTLGQFILPRNDSKFGEWISDNAFSIVDKLGRVSIFEI